MDHFDKLDAAGGIRCVCRRANSQRSLELLGEAAEDRLGLYLGRRDPTRIEIRILHLQ
jgi:hypothetical protein